MSIEADMGDLVQKRREELALSRDALAALIGVDAGRLSLWEGGLERIPPRTVIALAEALDLPPSRFFDGASKIGDGDGQA